MDTAFCTWITNNGDWVRTHQRDRQLSPQRSKPNYCITIAGDERIQNLTKNKKVKGSEDM